MNRRLAGSLRARLLGVRRHVRRGGRAHCFNQDRNKSALPQVEVSYDSHNPRVMEAERVPLEEQRYEEEVLRFYKLAKHAEWQVRDLPWGDKPPIPETRGTPSPQREARRRDLWRSVITQQLQADELAVE